MKKHLEELVWRLEGEYAELKDRCNCDEREHELKQALKVARHMFARGIDFCWSIRRGR